MEAIKQIVSFLGVVIIFALVLYGSYICTKKVAKMSYRGSQSRYMKLEDQLMLGQDKYLAVVSISGIYYLVGVTGNGISLLSEIKEENLQELKLPVHNFVPGASFQEVLRKLGKDKEKS